MAKEKSAFPVALSVLFATLLSGVVALFVMNKLSIWGLLGTGDRFRTIFASVYAVGLTVSGWLYGVLENRAAGITHAVLMFGIAGIVFCGVLSGLVSRPESDNAAVGIVAGANLVFLIIGAVATICGVAVMCRLFPRKEKP